MTQNQNPILAHAIKAIQFRFGKAIYNSNDKFGEFKIHPHTRTPNQIVNHMFDLVNKSSTMIKAGNFDCPSPEPLPFNEECERLSTGLDQLYVVIRNHQIEHEMAKKLLQGPILDITTHVGQIAMLNGINGNKVDKISYYNVDI